MICTICYKPTGTSVSCYWDFVETHFVSVKPKMELCTLIPTSLTNITHSRRFAFKGVVGQYIHHALSRFQDPLGIRLLLFYVKLLLVDTELAKCYDPLFILGLTGLSS